MPSVSVPAISSHASFGAPSSYRIKNSIDPKTYSNTILLLTKKLLGVQARQKNTSSFLAVPLTIRYLLLFSLISPVCFADDDRNVRHERTADYEEKSKPCLGGNIKVSDQYKLKSALLDACPGTTLSLREGIWMDLKVVINTSGTMNKPITLKAEKPGKTFIEGSSFIEVNGRHVIVEGLYFRNGSPGHEHGAVILLRGENNHLTQTTIDNLTNKSVNTDNGSLWVSVGGRHNIVSYNRFKNKAVKGNMLAVERDNDTAQNHHIHHNHFLNFESGKKQNGWEAMRIGDSVYSQSSSFTLIENNRFDSCDGEIELVSIKSGKNIFRGNTIVNSQGHITSRHGVGNTIENNIFIQDGKEHAGAIRLYDGGHIVRNNYITGIRTSSNTRGGIVFHSGVNLPGTPPKKINKQWTTNSVIVENNTIFDSEQSYLFDAKKTHPAENIVFKNNIIVPALFRTAWRMDLEPKNLVFLREHYSATDLNSGKVTDFEIPKGISFKPFKLEKNDQGLWLHPTIGAQNLILLTKEDVGPTLYK